ncbi:MAG: hypothetical protein ACRD26_02925 [Vicinamibacterales bacterium]
MRRCLRAVIAVTLVTLFVLGPTVAAGARQSGHLSHAQPSSRTTDGLKAIPPAAARPEPRPAPRSGFPLLVRPATLAAQIEELAGHTVRVPYARVVGVFNPRVFLIDTATRLPPVPGHRARVLVLVEEGGLMVPPSSLVASTVVVAGIARTLLGMQVSREVPWPTELRPEMVERLEVKAAVLATSVQTAEGVELTGRGAAPR